MRKVSLLFVVAVIGVVASCQNSASNENAVKAENAKVEAAKAEAASLIQNSETFKLPADSISLTTGTIYGMAGGEQQLEALERAGLIRVVRSVSDEGHKIEISLTRRGEEESKNWEHRATPSEYNNTLEDWTIPIAEAKLVEINHFVQENEQTADVKFTFQVVPNKTGKFINDFTHQIDEKKNVARVSLQKRDGKWTLSEKELQDSIAFAMRK